MFNDLIKEVLQVFKILREIETLDWLNYNLKLRRMLVFVMMRVQKPFYFTMGLGIPLDMKVFMTVSFAYFLSKKFIKMLFLDGENFLFFVHSDNSICWIWQCLKKIRVVSVERTPKFLNCYSC